MRDNSFFNIFHILLSKPSSNDTGNKITDVEIASKKTDWIGALPNDNIVQIK